MYLRLLVVAGSAAFLNLALSATWQFGGPIAPGTTPQISLVTNRPVSYSAGMSCNTRFVWARPIDQQIKLLIQQAARVRLYLASAAADQPLCVSRMLLRSH